MWHASDSFSNDSRVNDLEVLVVTFAFSQKKPFCTWLLSRSSVLKHNDTVFC